MKKIAVMVESHYDQTETDAFTLFFPIHGYEIEFISNLRGAKEKYFKANDSEQTIYCNKNIRDVDLKEYAGLFLVGGYGTDMLRFEVEVEPGGEPEATTFLRRAMATDGLVIGTICHSLWLFTPAPELLKGREVTCGHNVISDVRNCGAKIIYDAKRKEAAPVHVEGNLVTGRHPYVIAEYMWAYLGELDKRHA